MVELCGDTNEDGKSSGSLPGCTTSAVSPRALIIILKTTWALFISLVSKSCSIAIFETTCNLNRERRGRVLSPRSAKLQRCSKIPHRGITLIICNFRGVDTDG